MELDNLNSEYADLYKTVETAGASMQRLIDIIAILRTECPWDREQNHESLKVCLIEEAYEVCDAIDRFNIDDIKEELGDVLLQVVFHSQIEKEKGTFLFEDVANGVCEKMIRRHPHIFSGESAKSVDKTLEKWENVKRREKGSITTSSSMEGIPGALPSLIKSYKLQEKAANVGFDWENVQDALAKVTEEKGELEAAMRDGSKADMEMELGDLLFSIVNIARFLGIDPEQALNRTSQKFIDRFSYIEKAAGERKMSLEDMTLNDMDALWNEAKNFEKDKESQK